MWGFGGGCGAPSMSASVIAVTRRSNGLGIRIQWHSRRQPMADNVQQIQRIWNQERTPVVMRRKRQGERPRVRLPFAKDNRTWLNTVGKSSPTYVKLDTYWEIPATWFSSFVNHALKRYGKLYVIQPHNQQEKCAPACMNAEGHECQCSCLGANHGQGNDGSWFEVSETFATRWMGTQLACRLMVAKQH